MGGLLFKIWSWLLLKQRSHRCILQWLHKNLPWPKRIPLWLYGTKERWQARRWKRVYTYRLPKRSPKEGDSSVTFQKLSGRNRKAKPQSKGAWRCSETSSKNPRRGLREEVDANTTCYHVQTIKQGRASQLPRSYWNHAQFWDKSGHLCKQAWWKKHISS